MGPLEGLRPVALLFLIIWRLQRASCETLTPPYFNLAEGKNITATATCGVDTEGPELYCKLIGSNSDNEPNVNVIQGQYCDYCDPRTPGKHHPPEHAVDGKETWWQSPPLSRGMKYQEVNLTIDLGQEFHVAYVYITMGNSPRPGLWVLEKSADYGKTYTPWQYFSDSPADCETYFGKESLQPITRDDSVICTTEYSKIVPLEGGEIPIGVLKHRPSATHYFNSTVLQEWTRATNVRFRFLRTKNLLGHLMSVARQDPTVTRRYFYSIKDISIGGRCMCNGHAQTCDIPDPKDPRILMCNCRHNTCGSKCNVCCPGFEQKAWRQSKYDDPFKCEPCNCFQHSNECVYDAEIDKKHLSLDIYGNYKGGGICQNCRHNTEGINCNKCKPKFFRPYNKHWNETDVCHPCNCDNFYSTGNCAEGSGRCECKIQFTPPNCDSCSFGYYSYPECKPCECFINGTVDLQCSYTDGTCHCKENFDGKDCKECSSGYYNFPECTACECDAVGSDTESCDQSSGNCTCKANFSGQKCSQCQDGFFDYPSCKYCNCDIKGTKEGICDKGTGKCICKEGYGGERCDVCVFGFYGYPDCKPCNCNKVGSLDDICNALGKCNCLDNYAGRTCDQCSPGYYSYPECRPCECDTLGSLGLSCDNDGKCSCHDHFAGLKCNQCKEGFYNFPTCEDCNCHPAGVVEGFAGCGSVPAGELCECKERVEGRICNKCKPLFWNLSPHNAQGCEECNCNKSGVLGGIAVCDSEDGQCVCKPSVVARGCSECVDGTYKLEEDNLFGCTDCGCDVGGSINNVCNKKTGQCLCQSRVTGRTCKEPLQAHYFPTLYQYQYEVEDGRTAENTRVRYAHDENIFSNYSWKGYAVFSSHLQREVIQEINIFKPSLYRIVFRYVNPNPYTVTGGVRIIPDNPNANEQYLKVHFKSTPVPDFTTASGESSTVATPFVVDPGRWSINININDSVLLDYFVLLPEDFYLATVLNYKIETPCTINQTDLCRHYAYPNISYYDRTFGVGGYTTDGKKDEILKEYFKDSNHLQNIKVYNRVPLLNSNQSEVYFNLTASKPGAYVLLVNYITPLDDLRTHRVNVVAQSKYGPQNGNVILYSCPYTSMCRQVVTNERDGVGIFEIDGNSMVVQLKSEDSNVGIHSIYLIPYAEWSLDFIKPKPVCVSKDGNCVVGSFINPPETKKIQFEQDVEEELLKNRPPIHQYNNNTYIWLNKGYNTMDLRGKVPYAGYYSFVLHYYQPDHPAFNLDVIIQNGQFYEASVPIEHCPSESGCRSPVFQSDRNNKFNLLENFLITFKQPENRNVYLDYILVIPADLYNERSLQEEDLDRTGEFISTCGSNNFNIDTSHKGFCRDSVFSITASHNTGALPCQCDYAGSVSFECEKFGGQCPCKDNIIGRQCTACKTGYFGFPDCRPCNCPSTAYCQPETGKCICPPHVIGAKCEECEPRTFGYDKLIGCETCNCNPLGVLNDNLQCDTQNGRCPCKANIVGRTCDNCEAGYFSFPDCASCDCNVNGTDSEICDKQTAECFCKRYVVGLHCEFCKEGSFNLQSSNPDGCTQCYCSGKATKCGSAKYVNVPIYDMSGWSLVGLTFKEDILNVTDLNITTESLDSNAIGVVLSNLDESTVGYFSAPQSYLGKLLASYGGSLAYSIFFSIGPNGSAIASPDVVLQGPNGYLQYSSVDQPSANVNFEAEVDFSELVFSTASGDYAKRTEIMDVLKDLKGIYIKASYWTHGETTRLTNVNLGYGIPREEYRKRYPNYPLPPDMASVEQCVCEPNYQGLSCEECSPGYYRIKSEGSLEGACVPCDCNGHSNRCDVNTGVCLDCQHNTRGDHCELCDVGYHGDARGGTPNDCLICACPLPTSSNNFATACDVSSDGEHINCDCKEGYFGARCQGCAAGFYGRPEVLGDYCKPCKCSGNIDVQDPSSCDTETGKCLRCLNNTFGEACALCAPGFYGDAIERKDCQACICDEYGTSRCDHTTGICVCKQNVVGEKCDRCLEEHYGFQSGQGCTSCGCAEAAESNECVDATGQCRCKPGVTGRACDRCSAGYWNYTAEGCVSCGCKSEFSLGFGCNALTGQCECLPGVIGEKCDQCPHRWAFLPDSGCHQCDNCHHALLNETDLLAELIDPVIREFNSTQSGYFTRRRLDSMREQLEKLKPKFDELDPSHIDLSGPTQELESLEQDSKNLNRKSNYSLQNSEERRTESTQLKDKAEVLYGNLPNIEREALKAIEDIDKISGQISEEAGSEVEKALQEGQALLDDMKIYNLTGREQEANKQLEKVNELLNNVTQYKIPVENLEKEVEAIKGNIKGFNDKLDDLYNHTQYSLNTAKEAENIIARNGKDRLKGKLDNIDNQISQSKINLDDSEGILVNASELIDTSIGKLKQLQDLPDELDSRNKEFSSRLDSDKEAIDNIKKLKPQVQDHASNLSEKVEKLEHILSDSQFGSKDAIRAARAYRDIVDAVKSAHDAAESAQNDTDHAVSILSNVQERTLESDGISSTALDDAQKLKEKAKNDLEPALRKAILLFNPVKGVHENNDMLLKDVEQILKNIEHFSEPLDKNYRTATKMAEEAISHTTNVDEKVNASFAKLPEEKEKAQALPKEVDDIKRDVIQTQKQIDAANETLPSIIESLEQLPNIQKKRNETSEGIKNSINKLSQQIELARDIANQIKVGVKFYPNTTLELRNPSNIEDLTTSTKISGYFKTDKPNGLIFYLGNPNGTSLRKTKTDDYMALIVQNGFPVLNLDIGNGREQVILNDKRVDDGVWYQFIIERVGHNVKLSIREEYADGQDHVITQEQSLQGPLTIFNLDKEKSKLFVGGFPVNYDMQHDIDVNSFDGEIEDLVVGNNPVSLWNFVEGYENNHGAVERDKLVVLQPSTGYRFNGQGYVLIDARSFQLRLKSAITLAFKTFATEGLLFLAGKENTFVALELRNGKILYQYNLGSGTKKFASTKQYNDGNWHKISAIRDGARGKLTIDNDEVMDVTQDIAGSGLEMIETVTFGGYPHPHPFKDVTNIKFDGCINNVTITGELVDLRNHLKSFDVTPGCPAKFAPLVSFNKSRRGYVGWDRISIDNDLHISLKFKTREKNGLVFYLTDADQSNGVSLALVGGHLKVISQKIELVSSETFDDGDWHVVSVIHNGTILRIDFDDLGNKVTDSTPPPLHVLHATMYVGGLPRRIRPLQGTVGSEEPFHGCITDLTVNGNVKNFANTTDKLLEILDKCILDADYLPTDPSVHLLPELPPIEEATLPPITEIPIVTEDPFHHINNARGDGGLDVLPESGTQQPKVEQEQTEKPAVTPAARGPVPRPPLTTPKPAQSGCALPASPPREDLKLNGHRFGAQPNSRMEYNTPRGKFRKSFDFTLEFKTSEPNGILFYVSDIKGHKQYASLLLSDSYLVFTFKTENPPLVIKSDLAYNDNEWHYVEFSRQGSEGKLIIDNKDIPGRSVHKTQTLDLHIPFYLGGIHPDATEQVLQNLNTTAQFKGCIRNFHMNNKPMENPKETGVIPCSDNVEFGTYFGGGPGTFVKLKERYNVGQMFNIKMDIKPRVNSGLLIAVHGKRDCVVLEMAHGNLRLTVDNGKANITTTYIPPGNDSFSLCDGQWHEIQAVKSKNVVTLSVDKVFTDPQIGPSSVISSNTGSALFLGGHKFIKRVRGITSRTSFVGCIKNVYLNNDFIDLESTHVEGNVTVGTCRTD